MKEILFVIPQAVLAICESSEACYCATLDDQKE